MIEYAVINYAQIVYIRKQIHDLQGLDSNAAVSVFFQGQETLYAYFGCLETADHEMRET